MNEMLATRADWFDHAPNLSVIRGAETIAIPPDLTATEDAVAAAFADAFVGSYAFDHTEQRWMAWQGGRWQRDERSSVFHQAREYVRAVRGRMGKPPAALSKIAFVAAIERACRSDPQMAVSADVWDRDPWLLGTADGVVDLRNGQVRPNYSHLHISRHTAVVPAPEGTSAPLWEAFLDSATSGDKELQRFLQRLGGYFLTGDVSEEVLMFLYGPGGNGKGVFISAITNILHGYAVSVPIEVFTAGARINLEYYRAQMAGVRLVTASETESQATWAESQIKEMTGNEAPISGRHPHGRPFTFRPQFKIAIVGNHAPKLKGRSPAMERRLRVVPFAHMPATPDLELKDKLREEYPAILRWMIDGCLAWQRDRLESANVIRAATSVYFEQQDAWGRWIEERCILAPGLTLAPGALLADFNAWARANGEILADNNSFAESIDRTRGLCRGKSNGKRVVRGIGLKPPEWGWASD